MNYGVTFPMMDKVSVKHGCISIFDSEIKNGLQDSKRMEFSKYLINEKGSWIK
jgi:glutathione peroxidase